MVDKDMLQAISEIMDTKLRPIESRLEKLEHGQESIKADLAELEHGQEDIKADLAELKEYAEITRDAVNSVAEWADNAGFLLKIPFNKSM